MNTNELSTVSKDREVAELITRIEGAEKFAAELVIEADADLSKAVTARTAIADMLKQAEKRRKFFVDPYNALVKSINGFFVPISDRLDAAKRSIDGKMIDFRNKQEAAAEQARLKALADMEKKNSRIDKQVEKGKITEDDAAAKKADNTVAAAVSVSAAQEPAKTVRSDDGAMVSFRTVLKVQVVDESLVPRQYCTPDPKKYKDIALAFHKAGQQSIPGIKVVEEKVPTSRSSFGF